MNVNMNETRKAYEVLFDAYRKAYDDGVAPNLVEALDVALPIVRANIKCDRCAARGRSARAAELSDTGWSYCARCYRAVTNEGSPY